MTFARPAHIHTFMLWNRRIVRIAVGLALLVVGLIVVLPSITGHTSLDGTINARFVIVASPIEGTVVSSAPKSGTIVAHAEHLLSIRNDRVTRSSLTELSGELRATEERLQALALQESELNSLSSTLQERIDAYRGAMIVNLDQLISMQTERISANEARRNETKNDLTRKEQLRLTGHLPESDLDRARALQRIAEREYESSRFEFERLKQQRDAARRNVFVGEGRNDVPYSLQRVDEIKIALLDLATRRREQEARYVKLRAQVSEQEGYLQNLGFASLRSDFDGVMWRNNVVAGSNVVVGTELLSILDCSDLFVDIVVHEANYDDLYPGLEAEVRLFGRDSAIPGHVLSVRGSRADMEDKVLAATPPRIEGKYARIRVQLSPSDLNTDYQNYCQVGRTAQVRFRTRSVPFVRWLRSLWFSIS